MAITNGYASLSDVKAALRISDSIDDALIELAIESASREIDGYAERVFYSVGTATRVYVPTDSFLVEIDDLRSITTLRSSPDGAGFTVTWSATDYQLEPLNGFVGGISTPYTRIRAVGSLLFPIWETLVPDAYEATVQVTGVFGFATVPTAIKQATVLLSMRQFKRYDSPLGVAGFGDLGAMRVTKFDPDVEALVAPFRKVRMA
jgi:hypothetical protein